ncbi:hypothetical protein BDY19DRAFT_407114 [Irpex rosettiformis]|uniref:Uncharacterized protein n=1 Tax=Irpex rosettiformis TaxID=378272 RepID=A0ACB8UGB4_9APHY|nr:hypothetical protein BDY19DRAFT_407114 [Irpex rosettiformis]
MSSITKTQKYGWTAVPRDASILLSPISENFSTPAPDFDIQSLLNFDGSSDASLLKHSADFVKEKLSEATLNHSLRVYVYGAALVRHHFPTWKFSDWREAYYLSCLFHDIGTADFYLPQSKEEVDNKSKLSFEFKGGIVARDFILQHAGVEDLADAVCEAVIRHQDVLVQGGNITIVGQVLQLATLIDNVSANAHLISAALVRHTITAFPRLKWSSCFVSVLHKEFETKPWCHSTTFERPGYNISAEEGKRLGVGLGDKGVIDEDGFEKSNFVSDVKGNMEMNQFE